MIVSALSAGSDPRMARPHATWVTCVAAALAELLPAVGVYWVTADNVIEPAQMVTEVQAAGATGVPFDMWVATHFYPGPGFAETGAVIARTTGLSVFVGREIECGPYARALGELGTAVRAVGWYVLDRGVTLWGGETVGTEEAPIGRVELGRTAVGAESGAVYRVMLGERADG